jgi:hypothetical protein
MSIQRHFDTITVVASQDLTGHQFKAVDLSGGVAVNTLLSMGILQNKAALGDHATLAYRGHMKAYAGGAINSGAQVGVTASGFLISVATSRYVGVAMTSAASGDIFDFVGDHVMGLIA